MPSPNERFDRISSGQAYRPPTRALDPLDIEIQPGWNVRDMSSPDTSAKETVAKSAPSLLELADAMYRLILDPNIALDELERSAKAYGKVRGL